jgi:hypothetical protein
MTKLFVSLAAFFALSSVACAMDNGLRCVTKLPHGMTQAQVDDITASMGPTHTSCLVASPADCEPRAAEPVWGPHQELAGFSCYERSPRL